MVNQQRVIAVVPARDEALSIGQVIDDIFQLCHRSKQAVFDRVLVCDNGSVDDTAKIAREHGAEVIYQSEKGYGVACLTALSLVNECDIVVFIDADASLCIDESKDLLAALEAGADLAIGVRLRDLQQAHSMTMAQRFGNWLASALIRIIWAVPISDLGPFRAIRYSALQQLEMRDRRYGWTVEMQVKAIQHGLRVCEVPVHYYRRIGRSKISGTMRGVIGAGTGIISMILKLALRPPTLKSQRSNSRL